MRVLIVAKEFPPDMGGGATRAYNAAKGLTLNGCKVVVITAFPHYPHGNIPAEYRWKPLKVEYKEGLKIIRTIVPPLPSKGLVRQLILFLFFMLSSLFALPFVGKVDVIWAANPNILSVFPAIIYGLFKRAPIALNVDDLWPEDIYDLSLMKRGTLMAKLAEFLAKVAYTVVNLITPISPGYVDVITKKYGVSRGKIYVVRAGVDSLKFKPARKTKPGRKLRVAYSGAFSVAYDFDQVLLAAKELEKRGIKDVEFVIQGGGELGNYIKQKVNELGLTNVIIIDKIMSRDEVAEFLNEADVLLLPLRDFGRPYLGISSKLYEYQAVGKPIICCAVGQPAMYVRETNSGIVVKPGDYEQLAEAILTLYENPVLARELGENGRRYVERYVAIDSIGKMFKEKFKELVRK